MGYYSIVDFMKINQGDIFLANLNPTKGHEQFSFRPILILQNNILNENLNTVIIAPITSNLIAKGFLTTYFLDKKTSKLKSDSLILLHQIRTIDKSRLKKKINNIGEQNVTNIKQQFEFIF